jgi:hypothetical protein
MEDGQTSFIWSRRKCAHMRIEIRLPVSYSVCLFNSVFYAVLTRSPKQRSSDWTCVQKLVEWSVQIYGLNEMQLRLTFQLSVDCAVNDCETYCFSDVFTSCIQSETNTCTPVKMFNCMLLFNNMFRSLFVTIFMKKTNKCTYDYIHCYFLWPSLWKNEQMRLWLYTLLLFVAIFMERKQQMHLWLYTLLLFVTIFMGRKTNKCTYNYIHCYFLWPSLWKNQQMRPKHVGVVNNVYNYKCICWFFRKPAVMHGVEHTKNCDHIQGIV